MLAETMHPVWWLTLILVAIVAGFFWSFGDWLFKRIARAPR